MFEEFFEKVGFPMLISSGIEGNSLVMVPSAKSFVVFAQHIEIIALGTSLITQRTLPDS